MRTPLAAILGYLQLALRRARKADDPSGQKLVEYLSAAEGMAGRLTDLVADSRCTGRWDALVVVKPLDLVGGVGSPPNATALR